MLQFCRLEFYIPCEKDFRVLLAGDTHLILADEMDNQRKRDLAKDRINCFGYPEPILEKWNETIDYANENCDLFLHVGDLIDFVSHKNLAVMKESMEKIRIPFLMAAGNHEFSQYVGEAFEDDAYKAQTFDIVQAEAANSLDFCSRVFNGVNFVAIDNVYYLFKERHIEMLKKECEKGLPIVLLLHTPLYTPDFFEQVMFSRKTPCAYLCGTPPEKMESYPENRRRQQMPDAVTLKMLDYLRDNPMIKGIWTGHFHTQFFTWFTPSIPMIVTGGNHRGEVTEIVIRNPKE